jgi:hypothetical protein
MEELEPLVSAVPQLDLGSFEFISIHAPSHFDQQSENRVLELLSRREVSAYPVVVHPDVIFTPALWHQLGDRLLIENMDKRKPIGRTVRELLCLFDLLPNARFCFDIGHARQIDPTMTESALLLHTFGDRLAEVHISEVNTASRHDPISGNAASAFQSVAKYIPAEIPIILEPLLDDGQSELEIEMRRAREALSVDSFVIA